MDCERTLCCCFYIDQFVRSFVYTLFQAIIKTTEQNVVVHTKVSLGHS
jgi:hypothetical protein